MKIKPHLALDGYKTGHGPQYPEGTTLVYSNLTARSAGHAKMTSLYDNKVVVAGIQGFVLEFLIESWNEGFFNRPKDVVVAEYKRRMDCYLGPDAVGVDHIAALHDMGYLPLRIKALPEGTRVNIKVPFVTFHNTHPAFFWLTNYIETIMSAEIWPVVTIATIAYEYRRLLNKYVEATGSDIQFADWQLHDFSMRGLVGIGGAYKTIGHLFAAGHGTDTLPAIDYLETYYGANVEKELVGGSVPATEHSVMCMGGKDDEVQTFRRLITELYPSGIVSIVSDTWDFWNVITNTANILKEEILAREVNALGQAKVVFRPDSGDPVDIICGTVQIVDVPEQYNLKDWAKEVLEEEVRSSTDHGEMGDMSPFGYFRQKGVIYRVEAYIEWNRYDKQYYYIDGSSISSCEPAELTPAQKGAVECLWDIFGGTVTDKGFKTLNQRVGLIYGDSITLERAEAILKRLMDKGFSAGNIVFGIGSYTYQYITRDTFGMAVKATYGIVNGEQRELFKDPATDNGVKKSAKGLLRVEKEGDDYVLYDQQDSVQEEQGELQVVFRDGKLYNPTTYAEVVARLKQ
jgi:nicotinamide phosphoribosyltransferase